jgi:prepilin-type N-terminal cleavage/methylation domain-containing protein
LAAKGACPRGRKIERGRVIMYQKNKRRFTRMPRLIYPPTKVCNLYIENESRHDIGGSRGGFTVIELIIVVVILAIVGLVALPMISSAGSVQIRSAANMISADLEYARSMAISRGQNFSVEFDKNTESYWIEDQAGNVIPHPVKKGFNYIIDFRNDGRLNSVDITNVDFNMTATVLFDCLGSPDNGGTVILQADGNTKTITVEPVTGFISIQ